MTDIGYYPAALLDKMQAPTVSFVYLAKFWFDGGSNIRRFYHGVGSLEIDGETWEGFANPDVLSCVKIGDIKDPEIDAATAVNITLLGVDASFLSQVRQDVSVIYGSAAEVYVQLYDFGSYQPIGDKIMLFEGFCGMPTFTAAAIGTRTIALNIDSIWASKNFSPGGRISDADQKARFSGDKGMEFVGTAAAERVK